MMDNYVNFVNQQENLDDSLNQKGGKNNINLAGWPIKCNNNENSISTEKLLEPSKRTTDFISMGGSSENDYHVNTEKNETSSNDNNFSDSNELNTTEVSTIKVESSEVNNTEVSSSDYNNTESIFKKFRYQIIYCLTT